MIQQEHKAAKADSALFPFLHSPATLEVIFVGLQAAITRVTEQKTA